MATYLHFAPAIALAVALGPSRVGWRLVLAGAACGVIPDLDFLSIKMGFDRYGGTYGHRGFTHSLSFAVLMGFVGVLWPGGDWRRRVGRGCFLALCAVSHPLMDGLLDVGICNAWLWPLDGARHCLDRRPIPMRGVPLFGQERFLLELLWIGMPLLLMANLGVLVRLGWSELLGILRLSPEATESMSRKVHPFLSIGPRERRVQRAAAMQSVGRTWMVGKGANYASRMP